MNGYGNFGITLGVPSDYDGHRCQYARETLRERLGAGLVDALVIQRAIPVEPVDGEPDKEYYEFGGNIKMERVE
jgi:hypothetical protein